MGSSSLQTTLLCAEGMACLGRKSGNQDWLPPDQGKPQVLQLFFSTSRS